MNQVKIVGKLVETGVNVALDITDGKIVKLNPGREESPIWIAPPLVDLQINGFGGHDLNAETISMDDVCQMVEAVRLTGTGYLCPTVVTGSAERMTRSIEAIQQATRVSNIGQSIVGIHVEGPYISSEDGPRGAHPKPHVRPPDWEEFQRWQELAEGQIKICTLAPEADGAIPFIEKLVEKTGVRRICVTLAEKGAIYFNDGRLIKGCATASEVRNTVGAGDAFMAAFIQSVINGNADRNLDFINRCCRLGAYVASQDGAIPDYDPQKILD